MKRTILIFMLSVCTVHAQTYYMNVRMKGGSTVSIPVQEIRKLTFTGVTDVRDERLNTVIKTFTLLQNYPNPFNPTTTIEYQLPRSGNVEIRIFSLTGQLVRSLTDADQPAGTHSTVWDAKNDKGESVSSGAYLCHVTFDNSVLTKKMLFIK